MKQDPPRNLSRSWVNNGKEEEDEDNEDEDEEEGLQRRQMRGKLVMDERSQQRERAKIQLLTFPPNASESRGEVPWFPWVTRQHCRLSVAPGRSGTSADSHVTATDTVRTPPQDPLLKPHCPQ
ncbi:hypothetical protein E2C01_033989 [Portunus trituberculatus]|uniref:Uncharacterized protein n=1 Tax=Portunus trituberculatus TaxID=210409 RepID=A0A5B7F0A2_PORTR|nr:hypothetical protein [Portunus trituberculatus]